MYKHRSQGKHVCQIHSGGPHSPVLSLPLDMSPLHGYWVASGKLDLNFSENQLWIKHKGGHGPGVKTSAGRSS